MRTNFRPRQRHAILFLGSLWAVALVFLVVRAFLPI
jgi:hypothetical protein